MCFKIGYNLFSQFKSDYGRGGGYQMTGMIITWSALIPFDNASRILSRVICAITIFENRAFNDLFMTWSECGAITKNLVLHEQTQYCYL